MKSPDDFLGRRIAVAHRVLHAELDGRMRERGADFTTWKVLAHLTDDRPSQRELAARILIDPATLVRHLDRLESDGLVTRERDGHDRRVVRIAITRAGRSMHATLHRVAEELDAELDAFLTPGGYDRVAKTLQRLTEHFGADAMHGSPVPSDSRGGAR
jgi:DNA-binding MarR family transcriptional regulator